MTTETHPTHLRNRLSILPLTAADVDQLRFGVWSRTSNEAVKAAISAAPGRSVWIPDTLEYAIVSSWRHRPEIANVQELSAVRHPAELLAEVVRRSAELGVAMVLSVEIDESRQPAFYARSGFSLIEEVMTYELEVEHRGGYPAGALTMRPADLRRPGEIETLVALDHRTFPWMWWNSAQEFATYADSPGVEIYLGDDPQGRTVAYIGITTYLGWGHLDRIAVLPDVQGTGLGRQALGFAIDRLIQLGARRVGLSTQRQNERSRRLYERAGFRHIVANDYRLYGKILRLPEGVDSATELI